MSAHTGSFAEDLAGHCIRTGPTVCANRLQAIHRIFHEITGRFWLSYGAFCIPKFLISRPFSDSSSVACVDHRLLKSVRRPCFFVHRSEEHTSELQSRGHL